MNSRLSDLFRKKASTISFEIFPPKTKEKMVELMQHFRQLKKFSPDFISVTYGAGGGTQKKSLDVLNLIHRHFDGAIVAHFTCVGLDRESIHEFAQHLKKMGIQNILALRGDPPQNNPDFDFSKNVFQYADELVDYLKKTSDLCIGVAGYPEGHPKALNKEIDWDHLKTKVEKGAEFIVTQLFFDNRHYFALSEAMEKRKINVPLLPGILPIPSIDSLKRVINLSGTNLTPEFSEITEKYMEDPVSFKKASIEYSQKQIRELIKHGVPGIHYYVLNRSEMISEVLSGL